MSKSILIAGITIADSENLSFTGDILIEEGKITRVAVSISADADLRIDAAGKDWTAVPGFIDVHIHGAAGFDAIHSVERARQVGSLSEIVAPADMRAFLAAERARGLSSRSLARTLSAVKHFARWLADHDGTEVTAIERCSGHDGTYAVKKEYHDISKKIARPVVNRVKKAETDHFISDCPMAADQISQDLEDREGEHPMGLLKHAYGL